MEKKVEIVEENKENLEIKKLKKEMKFQDVKVIGVYIFLFFELLILATILAKYNGFTYLDVKETNKVAVITLDKEITAETSQEVIEKLDKANKDKSYKEILFIMNSPGGSPSASEEISEYLKEINKQKNITMYIEGMAASGGYYIASSIKPLKSNKNAIVGSIGVIMTHYNAGELAKKIGIQEDNLSAGEYKQPISMFKEIDEKNKAYLKDRLLSPMYNNFVESMAINRGTTKEEIIKVAEGQVFLANDERIKGVLIDEITNLYKVKKEIENKYKKEIVFETLELEKSLIKEILSAKLNINLTNLETTIK